MSLFSQPISLIPRSDQRTIDTIQVNVVINENTTDRLVITKHPVQQGAPISDHAYLEPTEFSHTIYFSQNLNLSLAKIYQQLLTLQASFTPFSLVTPKRTYFNMLLATLSQVTDAKTENTLAITASYLSIITVPIGVVQVPRANQKKPGNTGATVPTGKKSIAVNGVQGVKGLLGGLF